MTPIDYEKLELFLKGKVNLEDLYTRQFNRFDITVFAYALVVVNLESLTRRIDDDICFKLPIMQTLRVHFPYFMIGTHVDASHAMGLHTSKRGEFTRLTLPPKFFELVEQYKDLPEGGIAKFTALSAETKDKPEDDGSTPAEIADKVIDWLRSTYQPDVLAIIRERL